jgi:acyl-CoA synthetase (NDP forming)
VARNLASLVRPRSIAVIGASPRPGSVAGEILRNLKGCGFDGDLFPVNPKHTAIDGLPCVGSVADLPDGVDLAVLAINREIVLDAVEACGEKGICRLIVITAGFKESGPEGATREAALRDLVARYDLSLVGPNCMGMITSTADVRMNASFSRWFPSGGQIAFISQSGSLGETLLECFEEADLGVSLFVNLGNRAGLTENDFLEYLAEDASCRAVFLYLESFAEPTAFRGWCERVAEMKPIVVLKAGRTEAGVAAVASHTGSLASSDAIVDAFLRQCGVLRVNTIEETITALRALGRGVLPRGDRTVILTNAGGAGIIAADACERAGINVPQLNAAVRSELAAFLPPEAGLGNPIDMIATAGAADYERGLRAALAAADSAIVIFRPPIVLRDRPEDVADAIVRASAEAPDKPVLACTLSRRETDVVKRLRAAGIPVYGMPETAVDALRFFHRVRDLRSVPRSAERPVEGDIAAARAILEGVISEGRTGLYFGEGAQILESYGIPVCPFAYAESTGEAQSFVEGVGFPLAAKIDSPEVHHRVELGAVATGIGDERELEVVLARLRKLIASERLPSARILLQEMLVGRELIFGVQRDPAFGPVVMFGIGGTFVEALKDVAFAVAPVSVTQAKATVGSIRAYPLLGPFRGQPAADIGVLGRFLAALGGMALDLPEIGEVDLNPIILTDDGPAAVDILMTLSYGSDAKRRHG